MGGIICLEEFFCISEESTRHIDVGQRWVGGPPPFQKRLPTYHIAFSIENLYKLLYKQVSKTLTMVSSMRLRP